MNDTYAARWRLKGYVYPWYLVIALCLVDGFLCHQLMKAWDKEKHKAEKEDDKP